VDKLWTKGLQYQRYCKSIQVTCWHRTCNAMIPEGVVEASESDADGMILASRGPAPKGLARFLLRALRHPLLHLCQNLR